MPETETTQKFGILWKMPIVMIFLVGGFLQYLGILSQTQSNWLALFLLSHVFLANESWKQVGYEAPLFIFMLYIAVDHLRHAAPMSYTVTYLYYVACTIIAAVAGRIYASRIASSISTESFFRTAKLFLFIELLVVVIQRSFTAQFISLSRAPIGYIDAIFGTFFLQSDAALAAVCELLTISSFFLYSRRKDRFAITLLSLSIIFLGNSNAAKIAVVFILALLLLYSAYRALHSSRYQFNILLLVILSPIILLMYGPLSTFLSDFFVQATDEYYHRGAWETAARFSPMGQLFAEGVTLLGQGALTYYNPMTKEWLYNAGFSTIYSLYLDFGLLGLLLYFSYQFILIVRFTRSYLEFIIFTCVFILFMVLNFALTDLAFVFSFNAILHLNYLRGRSGPGIRYEQSPFLVDS